MSLSLRAVALATNGAMSHYFRVVEPSHIERIKSENGDHGSTSAPRIRAWAAYTSRRVECDSFGEYFVKWHGEKVITVIAEIVHRRRSMK